MKTIIDFAAELVLGDSSYVVIVQYAFLIVSSLMITRRIIVTRIGSLEAVIVSSRIRFGLCVALCNLVYLIGYHLVLLIRPTEDVGRWFIYLIAAILSYILFAFPVEQLGVWLDGGRALRVITSRYKPNNRPGLIDLTRNFGRNAQLIPRGAMRAYQLLLVLSLLMSISVSKLAVPGLLAPIIKSIGSFFTSVAQTTTFSVLVTFFPLALIGFVALRQLSKPLSRKRKKKALGVGKEYWSQAYGEPEWVTVPASEFWMGDAKQSEAQPVHSVDIPEFQIARVPVTYAQYQLFVQATGSEFPEHWPHRRTGHPPKELANHPVLYVSWHDAVKYCEWLGHTIGKPVMLPTEAEWEKAARGNIDRRKYPWGDKFSVKRCNTKEWSLGTTSPVGAFPLGASIYGCLDMTGNVFEWTSSLWGESRDKADFMYPYNAHDGREDLDAPDTVCRVVRGGSFDFTRRLARCSTRNGLSPKNGYFDVGFRVVIPLHLTN